MQGEGKKLFFMGYEIRPLRYENPTLYGMNLYP